VKAERRPDGKGLSKGWTPHTPTRRAVATTACLFAGLAACQGTTLSATDGGNESGPDVAVDAATLDAGKATTACNETLAQYCAHPTSHCPMTWAEATTRTSVWCIPSEANVAFGVSNSPCEGFDYITSASTDTNTQYFYDHTTGVLTAIGENTPATVNEICLAGPGRFHLPTACASQTQTDCTFDAAVEGG
jgi:hypothetical protein